MELSRKSTCRSTEIGTRIFLLVYAVMKRQVTSVVVVQMYFSIFYNTFFSVRTNLRSCASDYIVHNEPHILYASPNIIKVFKSRRTRWSGHVALKDEMRIRTKFLSENLKATHH
jgi:hypothetical protein